MLLYLASNILIVGYRKNPPLVILINMVIFKQALVSIICNAYIKVTIISTTTFFHVVIKSLDYIIICHKSNILKFASNLLSFLQTCKFTASFCIILTQLQIV